MDVGEVIERLREFNGQYPDVSADDKTNASVFREFLNVVLDDDLLTDDEETNLFKVAEVLGIDHDEFESQFGDFRDRLIVARVNDGRLPEVKDHHLMLKRNEVVHAETYATLLKEVKKREYQGGYGGFSFRIAKGVRYHTGRTRGKSVVVGTELQEADSGTLSVSSQRIVFAGERSSIEMPYSKLMNLAVFSDGLRFHLSNRKTAPLLKCDHTDALAAIINAAAQSGT